jgi:hypothetical protein
MSHVGLIRIARMVGGIDLRSRADLGPVANRNLDHIEDDTIEVEEHAGAESNVEAVITEERRPNFRPFAGGAESLQQELAAIGA